MKKHVLFMLLLTSSMVLGIPTIVHAETTEDAAKEQVGTDFEVSAESEDIGTVSSPTDQSAEQSGDSENGSQTEKAVLKDSDNEADRTTVTESNGKQNESAGNDNESNQSDPHIEQNSENKDVPVLDSSNAMEETGNEVISTSTEESGKKQDESVNSESELLTQDSEEDNENTEATQAKTDNALDNSDNEDKNGFVTESDGNKYYYQKGTLIKGYFSADDQEWYADESTGIVNTQSGWFAVENSYGTQKFYGNEDGSLKTGLIEESGQKYYLNPYLMVGLFRIYDDATHESKYYATDNNGAVCNQAGWFEGTDQYGNAHRYYGNDDGSLKTGWFEENGQKYYLSPMLQVGSFNIYDDATHEYKYYATDKNGAVCNQTGWFEETNPYGNTYWYYGNGDGSVKTGWFEENGQKYYLDPELQVGIFDIYDSATDVFTYYLADNNGVVYNKVGWFEETDPYGHTYWYYGNDDGSLKTGWFEENDQKYYLEPMLQVGCFGAYDDTTREYKYYLADKYGHVYFKNGWIKDTDQYGNTSWYYGNDDGSLYTGDDGSLYTGWRTIDDKKYYFMPNGTCVVGTESGDDVYEIDGKSYHFAVNGALDTGWYIRTSDKSYGGSCWAYSNEDGTVVKKAWIPSGSDWYYLDENGVALTNTIAYEMKTDSGETYLVDYPDSNNMTQRIYSFDKEGRMLKKAGWQKFEDTYYNENGNQTYTQWCYLNADGTLYNNKWLLDNGYWYYFQDGIMVSDGISVIGNETYLFDENGHMLADGWKKQYDFWYYLNKDGTGYNGWLNGTYYIEQGKMLTSCYTPDGYFVDANGCWDKTVPQLTGNDGWKFEYGTPINDTTGWIKTNNRWYYVDPESHYIVRGVQEIDGVTSGFNQAGIWTGYVDDGWYKDCYDRWHMVKNHKILKNQWYGDYYLDSEGYMSVDSIVVLYRDQDGTQHYTDMYYSDGEMLAAYGVDQNGKWIKGWSKIETELWSYKVGRWRYFDPQNGKALPGWRMIDGRWYFFDDYGFMETGLISDAQDRCYFIGTDGTTLKTGWLQLGGEGAWYYFDSNGEGHNGILNYNGKQYCFEKGRMIRNGYYDGDWYNRDGVKTVLH